jgi:hypothetical protein
MATNTNNTTAHATTPQIAAAINTLHALLAANAGTDFSYRIMVHGHTVAASNAAQGYVAPVAAPAPLSNDAKYMLDIIRFDNATVAVYNNTGDVYLQPQRRSSAAWQIKRLPWQELVVAGHVVQVPAESGTVLTTYALATK